MANHVNPDRGIRTVTLELLRHGPPHNQLLSPLTRYLALCGNHPAETVTVPFEHQHFLTRQRALRYKESPETRERQLKETAQAMAEILSGVPGLIAEVSETGSAPGTLTHLRLVLSASELALLPFELADSPHGLPGAGQPLALQARLPICITRQARRVSTRHFSWPRDDLRILFAAAAPPGGGAIPLESHLLALRRAIEPWVKYFDESDPAGRRRRIEEHLIVLPRASLHSIAEACRQFRITHVHLLAHGVPIEDEENQRFGLALYNDSDLSRVDKVDGVRLATALRGHQDSGGLSKPAVVTLATCDGGAVGSVVGAGASVAHALHEAGVPLVVASQFPLTFTGSTVMVEGLYPGLLRGLHPYEVLSDTRRRMHTQVPGAHDWASLVAYAAFPEDLGTHLEPVRIRRSHASIEAALNRMDELVSSYQQLELDVIKVQFAEEMDEEIEAEIQGISEEEERQFSEAQNLLKQGKKWLGEIFDDNNSVLICGLLASVEKRTAEVQFQHSHLAVTTEQAKADRQRSTEALVNALRYYEKVFRFDVSASWAIVQYLALSVILGRSKESRAPLWPMARSASQIDLTHRHPRRVIWAHSNLCELAILAPLGEMGSADADAEKARQRALYHAREIVKVSADHPFHRYAAYRQFLRYSEWFAVIMDSDQADKVVPTAQAIVGEIETAGLKGN